MRVLLADNLFDGRHGVIELIEILAFALDERHIVLIEPEFSPLSSPHVYEWLAQRGRFDRQELELALELSLEAETKRDRAMRTICIGITLQAAEPRTTCHSLADARALLRRPLKILVENAHNDGAFVRRMLPPSWRTRLKRFEAESWAVFENGGGLGTLKITIRNLDGRYALRTVTIFDSDALRSDAPSSESDDVVEECKAKGVEWVRLKRRAAENYLPVASLLLWSEGKAKRELVISAFARLSQAQRHHFAMREGFVKDTSDGVPLPEYFADVNGDDRQALRRGFGKEARDLFAHDSLFPEHVLDGDDVHGERETLRALIFSDL